MIVDYAYDCLISRYLNNIYLILLRVFFIKKRRKGLANQILEFKHVRYKGKYWACLII